MFATKMYGVNNGRQAIWENQGNLVREAKTSAEAIKLAGLDYAVRKEPMFTNDGVEIPNFFANVRQDNRKVLGVVKGRYTNVQNEDAFAFMDSVLGGEVLYETAGFFRNGETIWILAQVNKDYQVLGDKISPFMVLTNSFDGSGSVKVAMTPLRISCSNTLNAALRGAKRSWAVRHTGAIEYKLQEARETLGLADVYMKALNAKYEDLYKIKLTDDKVREVVKNLAPVDDGMTERKKVNLIELQNDILYRYFNMPDLVCMDKTAARLIHAVSDTTSHKEPARKTKNFAENNFARQINGNDILDKAIAIVEGI